MELKSFKIWNEKEIELTKKHEKIIEQRRALLKGAECFFNFKDKNVSTFLWNMRMANERNNELLKKFNSLYKNFNETMLKHDDGNSRFSLLKNNYWTTVITIFPLWYKEWLENNPNRTPDEHPSAPDTISADESKNILNRPQRKQSPNITKNYKAVASGRDKSSTEATADDVEIISEYPQDVRMEPKISLAYKDEPAINSKAGVPDMKVSSKNDSAAPHETKQSKKKASPSNTKLQTNTSSKAKVNKKKEIRFNV